MIPYIRRLMLVEKGKAYDGSAITNDENCLTIIGMR